MGNQYSRWIRNGVGETSYMVFVPVFVGWRDQAWAQVVGEVADTGASHGRQYGAMAWVSTLFGTKDCAVARFMAHTGARPRVLAQQASQLDLLLYPMASLLGHRLWDWAFRWTRIWQGMQGHLSGLFVGSKAQ